MVCYECHKAARDPRVPVVEILKPEVFLSYDWGTNRQNQSKVSKIHRSIELKTGLHCWMVSLTETPKSPISLLLVGVISLES